MVFGWFTRETKSFYIARPDEAAGALIHLHPDRSIPRGSKLTVRSDECALFFREGRFIGRIDAGTVTLDTANIPFLGHLLVDRFTDANHFLCELFFVALNEVVLSVPPVSLGQYRDLNSANVVAIIGSLSLTVRVSDPARLLVELGGQRADSGVAVVEVLQGRLLNLLRRAVAMRVQQRPVLDIVSNLDAEPIGLEVMRLADAEFVPLGIGLRRVFDLVLSLDEDSLRALQAFGRQESELALQAKGMQLATGEGFAAFNLIQGQRAALEGLGKGLGSGNAPMLVSGIGLGANLTAPIRPAVAVPSSAGVGRRPAVLPSQPMFLMRTAGGETGPYTVRQIALLAIASGGPLSDCVIRGVDDPGDVAFPADAEPLIVDEYQRRLAAARASGRE